MHMPVAKAKQLRNRSHSVTYTSDMNAMMDEVSCEYGCKVALDPTGLGGKNRDQ